ncbi:MAG TPA: branched-chain amino acid ABC transporter permease [Myxococcaceae bacterium]|nr:branched-chain amino acid ABC transporter permease [Myxococcaceae bacterium]
MSSAEFAQIAVNAILLSGILALVALGFSLVWGIMNIVNLAHGAYVVLGAYFTFYLQELAGIDPFVSIPLSMLALFSLGFVIQKTLINQVVRAPLLATFLLTFGLEILIVNLVNFFFKADLRSVTTRYSGTGWTLGPVRVPYIRLAALGISMVLVLSAAWFLRSTRAGRAIRATGMDIDAARLTGVKVATIYSLTYAIGAALAGAAGSLLSMIVPFDPNFGGAYTQRAFVISVLGGLGEVANVVFGALLYAFVDVFVGARLPELSQAFTFAALVLLLVLRPQGIAGKKFYA